MSTWEGLIAADTDDKEIWL